MFSCPVWEKIFQEENQKDYMKQLKEFLKSERSTKEIFPHQADVFNALHFTAYEKVTTVILGQDPYHTPGVADGLAFSSMKEGYCPPSLEIVLKEIIANIKSMGSKIEYNFLKECKNFSLQRWAQEEGVLLLNPVLTVEKGKAGSHKDKGWEQFTKVILQTVANKPEPVVVLLWGKEAQKYYELFDSKNTICKHLVARAPHPAAELYNPKAGYSGCGHFAAEHTFRSALLSSKKSKKWPVNWLNLPNKSL